MAPGTTEHDALLPVDLAHKSSVPTLVKRTCHCSGRLHTHGITRCSLLLIIVGGLLLLIAFMVWPVFQYVLHNMVKQMMIIQEGTIAYKEWQNPDATLQFRFYFFTLTNRDRVRAGEKPVLAERGPYVYRMSCPKHDLQWFDNDTVSYRMPHTFYFDREQSISDENDTFTNVNLPMATLINLMADFPVELRAAAGAALGEMRQELFQPLTVNEFIWGYQDPLIDLAHCFVPGLMPRQFGMFYGFNGTDDGEYNVFTGVADISRLINIHTFRGRQNLTYWHTPQANAINGTDGTMFPPFLTKHRRLYAFAFDFCRSLWYEYEKEVQFAGLHLWRFTVPREVMSRGVAGGGFCPGGRQDACPPQGLLDVSACREGAPIFMSWPHFYLADPWVLDAFGGGINPVKRRHQTYMDVEPHLGVVPRSAHREQVNVRVRRVDGFSQTRGLPGGGVYMPILWLEVTGVIHPRLVSYLRYQLQVWVRVMWDVRYGLWALSAVLLIGSGTIVMRATRRLVNQNHAPVTVTNENTSVRPRTNQNEPADLQSNENTPLIAAEHSINTS